jgi:glucose-6-phosphate 1-dehydrogenase
LMDVVRGNQTLFMRRDEVDAAWAWASPIAGRFTEKPPEPYFAQSWGPSAANELLARDGRKWVQE